MKDYYVDQPSTLWFTCVLFWHVTSHPVASEGGIHMIWCCNTTSTMCPQMSQSVEKHSGFFMCSIPSSLEGTSDESSFPSFQINSVKKHRALDTCRYTWFTDKQPLMGSSVFHPDLTTAHRESVHLHLHIAKSVNSLDRIIRHFKCKRTLLPVEMKDASKQFFITVLKNCIEYPSSGFKAVCQTLQANRRLTLHDPRP